MSLRRGAALQLVLLILAVVAAGGIVLRRHLDATIVAAPTAEVRNQALWLARSAVRAHAGSTTVTTPYGPARVEVHGGVATVELAGTRAEVRAEPWTERFEP